MAWSPDPEAHPMITSSTSSVFSPLRSRSASSSWASMRCGCTPWRLPLSLPFPLGERTASMISASAPTGVLLRIDIGSVPARLGLQLLEVLMPTARSGPIAVTCPGKGWAQVTEARRFEDERMMGEAVARANIPTLLMVLVQLTGELQWIRAPYRPIQSRGMSDNDSGGLPDHIQEEIRKASLKAILSLARRTPGGAGGTVPPDARRDAELCDGRGGARRVRTDDRGAARSTVHGHSTSASVHRAPSKSWSSGPESAASAPR